MDVWKRGFFAWEYKGKHADLDKAYQQLLQYRESLENPPLLVVSDIDTIAIHTNFTNTVKQVYRLTLDDLLTATGMQRLRDVFTQPEAFRAPRTTEQVTLGCSPRVCEARRTVAQVCRRAAAHRPLLDPVVVLLVYRRRGLITQQAV